MKHAANILVTVAVLAQLSAGTEPPAEHILSDALLDKPRWVLVLSGGGARGIAQIGVLRVLERERLYPTAVVGTSIGAIIGALWCAGYSADEIDSLIRHIDWRELLKLGDERSRSDLFLDQKAEFDRTVLAIRLEKFHPVVPEAISEGYRFERLLAELLWQAPYQCNGDFDRLRIPFRAVATDLVRGQTVVLRRGDLARAVRASSTFPLRYAPVWLDSMVLVDGGLLANIPVQAANEFAPDIVIAVNTTSPLLPPAALDKPWNVADQAVSLVMQRFNQVDATQAWLTITPSLGDHAALDFTAFDTLIARGEEACQQSIPTLRAKLQSLRVEEVTRWLGGSVRIQTLAVLSSGTDAHTTVEEPDYNLASAIWNAVEHYGQVHCTYDPSTRTIRFVPSAQRYIKQVRASEKWLEHQLDTVCGQYYSRRLRDSLMRAIQHQFRMQGFPFARLRVEYDSATARLIAAIDSGKVVALELIGNRSVTDVFVRRELTITPGHVVRMQQLLDSWGRLVATDLFSSVSLSVRYLDSLADGVAVTVRVRERGSQVLRFGGRIDNERNVQPTLEFVDLNAWSTGLRVLARIGGGSRNSVASIRADMPRILESYWTASGELYWDSRNVYLYRPAEDLPPSRYERLRVGERQEQRYGVRISAGSNIETFGKIAVAFRYEYQRSFQLGDYVTSRLFRPLLGISIGTTLDEEDRADFPTQGSYASIRFERTLPLSGFLEFFKSEALLRVTTPLAPLQTLYWSVRFGIASSTLPLIESFNLGGEDLFYGMREEEERGRQLLLGQLGYRLRLPIEIVFPTYMQVRYDIGAVWQLVQAIKLDNLKHGVSIAVAFDTPIGPARFSVGRAFYFRGSPSAVTFGPVLGYFSIGMRIQ